MTNTRCTGLHDDGIADGNLTRCSIVSGCGLLDCPYLHPLPEKLPPERHNLDSDDFSTKGVLEDISRRARYDVAKLRLIEADRSGHDPGDEDR